MGTDKRNGAYINLKPGVKVLLDSICGLQGTSRTKFISTLIEQAIINTYNSMVDRDAVLDAQQTIAKCSPTLPTVFRALNEKVNGIVTPGVDIDDDDNEDDESY